MIGFDFDLYECFTIEEAVNVYYQLAHKGKKVLYFNGGTEIITFADRELLNFDSLVVVNKIPELKVFTLEGSNLYIGGANTLSYISDDTNAFPLLSQTCLFVADQTSRNKITLGGNLCSKLPFRNAILPFLITETSVVIANIDGIRTKPFHHIYKNGLILKSGDLVVQFIVKEKDLSLPFYTKKIRKIGPFGYPVVALSLVNDNGIIKSAYSGICNNAFHSRKVDMALNNTSLSVNARVRSAINAIPCEIISDLQGSAPYKKFVLKEQLLDALAMLGGDSY